MVYLNQTRKDERIRFSSCEVVVQPIRSLNRQRNKKPL